MTRSHSKWLFVAMTCLGVAVFGQGPNAEQVNPISELTGIVQKAKNNHSPFVLIIEGEVERVFLRGDVLKDVKLGSRVKVTGILKSELYLRSSVPPPSGWHIFMIVQTCRGISKAFDGERK